MVPFDKCKHNWKFSVDAKNNSTGSPSRPWVSFYSCSQCEKTITFAEKCALDSIELQGESNRKQEKSLNIAMWAMIIGAIATLCASFLPILFK